MNETNDKTMNLPSSEQLLNDLIKSLETEIEAEEKKVNDSIFALKVKKARLKKLKSDHQGDKAPLSEDLTKKV